MASRAAPIAAWKSSHEKLIAQGESTERELLIAQGEREHKLTPDEARRIRDREGFLGGLNLKQLGAMKTLGNVLAQYPDDGPSAVLLSRTVNQILNENEPFNSVWDLPSK